MARAVPAQRPLSRRAPGPPAGTDDCDALDQRARALQQRIRGIRIRVDVAALPQLQRQPSTEWTWRPIGQSDEQAQAQVA
ncbi:hypothetical protein [Streptomyces luteogriseus]|uniref:hypothetical protein n=1 Tax=Streptomyces luteogriseus TaxID=68233 RepID=UPI003820DD60